MEGGGGGGGDRLSSLPEHIIHHIFSFLDTIDTVKASAVTRKWRYFFVSMPHLNFESYRDSKYKIKFNNFVNWVLMSQNQFFDIQRFRISNLCLNENYAFYRLMDTITEFNLQELDLKILCNEAIKFPRCILNCRSLVSLKLSFDHYSLGTFPGLKNCIFPGFIRLKSLELCFVMFMDSLSLANFVSSCPYLENLNVHECTFVDDNIIEITANSLKDLSIILPQGEKGWTNHNSPRKIPNRTSSCLKYHHKIVELFQVGDDKYELDLVRFFLENGYVLQKMRISWVGRNLWDYNNRVYGNGNTNKFISEVMKFSRSSPNIALTFVEPEKLDRKYMNTTTTGDHAWASSSGVLPSDNSDIDTIKVESTADSDIDVTLDAINTKSIAASQGQNDTEIQFILHTSTNFSPTIAGVHLKERLKQLRKTYGFEIKNAVDLSVMTASVLHQPRFGAYGVRRLASEVLCRPWKPRSLSIIDEDWTKEGDCKFNKDQIECATVDAYAAYKIAKRLLSEEIVPRTFDFISL
ncbi:hypothetical protein LWI28_001128 [Acer negundo]|uniref:F-box domain-containing protein n=1 Tax=Acer negundo TaxID=4023 RepID=A0AAD5J2P3_ACENE|nr:hypothetical protein LWI28_001128 [Acer negundo]